MPSRKNQHRSALLAAILVACFAAGCLRHRVQASAPVVTAPQPEAVRPMNVAPDTNALPPKPADAPAPPVSSNETSDPLGSISKSKAPPAPPKPATEQPAPEPSAEQPARAPLPQISPQLSSSDQQAYEHKTNDDISAAEKNLQQANGRQLSAGQQDLVEKIKGFLDQSRDASKSSDWARAQNLAQKARLLSIELVNSL